jgi:PKD repeat protein
LDGESSLLKIGGNINATGGTFIAGTSTLEFNGTAAQNLTGIGNVTSPFYNLTVNNSGTGITEGLILSEGITIAKVLNMANGYLNLNAQTLTVADSVSGAIARANGVVLSEDVTNNSKIQWYIGGVTGSHVFPFGKSLSEYIPFTFNLTSGKAGFVSVATYATAADNTPLPTNPVAVTSIDMQGNTDAADDVIDRFWQVDTSSAGACSANLTFSYASNEKPASIIAAKAQRWNGTAWDPAIASQTNSGNSVTVSGVTAFSAWALYNDATSPVAPVAGFSQDNNSGCTGVIIQYTDTSMNNPISWDWNFPGGTPSTSTSQSPTVAYNTPGTYDVTLIVTNSAGSDTETKTAHVTIYTNPATPVITANGPTTFCDGGNVVLSSSSPVGNTWNPGGTTTQDTTISTSGNYTVMVSNGNGCSSTSNPITITVNPTTVTTITANGPLTFCDGDNVVLTSSLTAGITWNPNGETSQSITVNTSGSYSVTDNTGCGGTSLSTNIVVNPNPATPIITANGPTTFCDGGNVVLSSSSASDNTWSPGGTTTQDTTISTSGNYTVTVTDGNGCSSTSNPITITVNPTTVTTITANGPLTFCDGDNVVLTSSLAAGNTWNPNGETSQSITVNTSGSYSVTDNTGCGGTSLSTNIVVNPNPATPVITANGPTTFCDGGNVILSSSSASNNTWSPGGATTQDTTISTSGNYTVTVTDGNGCSSTSNPITITVNPVTTPVITANGSLTFCDGDNVVLTSSLTAGNTWNPNGETSQSITVNTSGSYSVTDNTGCGGTSLSTNIVVNPNPATPVITANGPTTFCDGDNVILSSSSASDNTWSPGGTTTQDTTISTSDDYTVTVTDGNGCSSTSNPITITVNPATTPVITPNGPLTFCQGDSVELSSNLSSGNVWAPGGETAPSIMVKTSGSFTVMNSSGCGGSSAAINVTANSLPAVTLASFNDACINHPAIILTGGDPSGGTYSGPGVSSGNFVPNTAGTGTHSIAYSYTDGNGCTNSDTADIFVDECVSVKEIQENLTISIFPNPTSGNTSIDFQIPFLESGELLVRNTLGEVVFVRNIDKNEQTIEIPSVNFSSGVYFVSINNNEQAIATMKLIVNQ